MGRLKTHEERQRKIMAKKEEKKRLQRLAIAARLAKPKDGIIVSESHTVDTNNKIITVHDIETRNEQV